MRYIITGNISIWTKKAIKLNLNYLSGDENYSFEVKCVRATYYIGKEKSRPYLKQLCQHDNDVILRWQKGRSVN